MRFIPTLMFGDITIRVFFVFIISSKPWPFSPVVPMTIAFAFFLTSLKFSRVASGSVKSITTSPLSITLARLPSTMRALPAPTITASAHLPTLGWCSISVTPLTMKSGSSRASLRIILPILPQTPVIIVLIIHTSNHSIAVLFSFQKSVFPEHPFQKFTASFRQGTQGQSELLFHHSHMIQGLFDRNGIRFYKHSLHNR